MRAEGGRGFHVAVDGHECLVTAPEPLVAELGAPDPETLVRASFDFLLAREPAGSILPRFDLSVIARYFPEWPEEMRRRWR
ncbi:MAG: hypothetical protein ACLQT7_05275 [Candidatus Dormibacteria bacterium]